MTTTTVPRVSRVNALGLGLTIADTSQRIPDNCSHYRSVEVWKIGSTKYRVTITVGNDRLRFGPGTGAVVEVWCVAQGWREVLTIPAEDHDVLGDLPTPPELFRQCGDMETWSRASEQIVEKSSDLADAAHLIIH